MDALSQKTKLILQNKAVTAVCFGAVTAFPYNYYGFLKFDLYTSGVISCTALNFCIKWLALANPTDMAISVMLISVVISKRSASRRRIASRYAENDVP